MTTKIGKEAPSQRYNDTAYAGSEALLLSEKGYRSIERGWDVPINYLRPCPRQRLVLCIASLATLVLLLVYMRIASLSLRVHA